LLDLTEEESQDRYVHILGMMFSQVFVMMVGPVLAVALLLKPVTLQGRGLQKVGGLHLALGYRVVDVVAQKEC
jgi:hypothetical protein